MKDDHEAWPRAAPHQNKLYLLTSSGDVSTLIQEFTWAVVIMTRTNFFKGRNLWEAGPR